MRSRLYLATLCLLATLSVNSDAATPRAQAIPAAHPPAPYAGPVNASYTHQAPPFHWGWFGAERFSPQVRWGRGYGDDLIRWSRHRRY